MSAGALSQIKAVILQGDPAYVSGLSYNVGTCKAGGVSLPFPASERTCPGGPADLQTSSTPARPASCVPRPRRYSPTVTLQTRTAATEAMQRLTKDTEPSTVQRHWLSSRPSSALPVRPLVPAHQPLRLQLPRRLLPQAALGVGRVLRCTVSVAVSGGQARRVARLAHAK